MMRQIKFRAWHPEEDGGTMYYPQRKESGQSIQFFPEGSIPWGIYDLAEECRLVTGDPNAIFNTPGILMQFTGLLDKNGKEIYEGDIAEIIEAEIRKYIICWGTWSWVKRSTIDGPSFSFDGIEARSNCEIIGNIHENPELLP